MPGPTSSNRDWCLLGGSSFSSPAGVILGMHDGMPQVTGAMAMPDLHLNSNGQTVDGRLVRRCVVSIECSAVHIVHCFADGVG